jgi:hypothetical protein
MCNEAIIVNLCQDALLLLWLVTIKTDLAAVCFKHLLTACIYYFCATLNLGTEFNPAIY